MGGQGRGGIRWNVQLRIVCDINGCIVLFYIESKNIIHVNYIYHILEFIQVDKDYIRLAFKYSARIENQHIILIFFCHFTFQLWIYLSRGKVSKLQTRISNWYIKVILTFLLRTKNNSVEGWRNCKGNQMSLQPW